MQWLAKATPAAQEAGTPAQTTHSAQTVRPASPEGSGYCQRARESRCARASVEEQRRSPQPVETQPAGRWSDDEEDEALPDLPKTWQKSTGRRANAGEARVATARADVALAVQEAHAQWRLDGVWTSVGQASSDEVARRTAHAAGEPLRELQGYAGQAAAVLEQATWRARMGCVHEQLRRTGGHKGLNGGHPVEATAKRRHSEVWPDGEPTATTTAAESARIHGWRLYMVGSTPGIVAALAKGDEKDVAAGRRLERASEHMQDAAHEQRRREGAGANGGRGRSRVMAC